MTNKKRLKAFEKISHDLQNNGNFIIGGWFSANVTSNAQSVLVSEISASVKSSIYVCEIL